MALYNRDTMNQMLKQVSSAPLEITSIENVKIFHLVLFNEITVENRFPRANNAKLLIQQFKESGTVQAVLKGLRRCNAYLGGDRRLKGEQFTHATLQFLLLLGRQDPAITIGLWLQTQVVSDIIRPSMRAALRERYIALLLMEVIGFHLSCGYNQKFNWHHAATEHEVVAILNQLFDLCSAHKQYKDIILRYLEVTRDVYVGRYSDLFANTFQPMNEEMWKYLSQEKYFRYDSFNKAQTEDVTEERAGIEALYLYCFKEDADALEKVFRKFWIRNDSEAKLKALEDCIDEYMRVEEKFEPLDGDLSDYVYEQQDYHYKGYKPTSHFDEPELIANLVAPWLARVTKFEEDDFFGDNDNDSDDEDHSNDSDSSDEDL